MEPDVTREDELAQEATKWSRECRRLSEEHALVVARLGPNSFQAREVYREYLTALDRYDDVRSYDPENEER